MLIRGATLLLPDGEQRGDCLVRDGRIAALGAVESRESAVDATGLYVAPGYIDLQCNGGFGHDFTAVPDTIWPVAAQLPRFGVTAFLPTIITSPLETVTEAQKVLAAEPPISPHATPLGLHVEGPFLNPSKKGAHNPAHLRPIEVDAVADWTAVKGVQLVTLAPELAGAQQLIAKLTAAGVVVSAGHSAATYGEGIAAFEAGVRYGTHLYNAMPPLHHREPGLVGALLADGRPMIGIIPDGVHVHPAMIKFTWQLAAERINIVTDAMAAMGCADDTYLLGDYAVTVADGTARLADGTLAGSVVTLDTAVRNVWAWTGCSRWEAVRGATAVPAQLLNLKNKGRLAVGCDADLVLLDADLQVVQTIIGGKIFEA